MSKQRKQYSAQTKFRVSLDAAKESKTISEIASIHKVAPTQMSNWKKHLLQNGATLFEGQIAKTDKEWTEREKELMKQIGRLQMELAWLKKKLTNSVEAKRNVIEPDHPALSIRRQCELLGLNRSSYYYEPAAESADNLLLMALLDEQYMKTPFYGRRQMTLWLRERGHEANVKRVARLMALMGIEAIYPKPKTSTPSAAHKIYPYLLRDVKINRPAQVWCSDITYIPMAHGFMYLVAVMDWYSRYVLSWQLSNTLDSQFCIDALERALAQGKPQIFNTDQGSQFTAQAYTLVVKDDGVQISMDGRGRYLDNIFIERLWRSLKYEDIYIYRYETVPALVCGLERYFPFYNNERFHQSLENRTPIQLYWPDAWPQLLSNAA